MGKKLIKIKILLKQNSLVLSIFLLWFIINYFVFYTLTNDLITSLLIIFYFIQYSGQYGSFYPVISEFVIFGVIFSVITTGFYRKYNPEQTSLALARFRKNHVVIIGYSHLGIRIKNYLDQIHKKWVIIEPNTDRVKDLIKKEMPIITKKPLSIDVLKDAAIQNAKLLITTENDIETAVVSTGLTRDINSSCRIICRIFDDSLADTLERIYGCESISTSKWACKYIMNLIKSSGIKDLILIGYTNVAKRLINQLENEKISYKLIERNSKKVKNFHNKEDLIVGDAKDIEILKKAGIPKIELVIVLIDNPEEVLLIADAIRELNKNCNLICRFFHEEVAEILVKEPFKAQIISQSKKALEELINMGVFDF